eukprot:gene15299-biopygen9233
MRGARFAVTADLQQSDTNDELQAGDRIPSGRPKEPTMIDDTSLPRPREGPPKAAARGAQHAIARRGAPLIASGEPRVQEGAADESKRIAPRKSSQPTQGTADESERIAPRKSSQPTQGTADESERIVPRKSSQPTQGTADESKRIAPRKSSQPTQGTLGSPEAIKGAPRRAMACCAPRAACR